MPFDSRGLGDGGRLSKYAVRMRIKAPTYYLCALENWLFLVMPTFHSFIHSFIQLSGIILGTKSVVRGGKKARVEPITRGLGDRL